VAKLFPARFPLAGDDSRWAEEQVFNALSQLDDQWRVFYSVAWQGIREGRQGDGEIDFVLLHPAHGLFCLEVKGGATIEVDGRSWFSVNRSGRHQIRNPFEQASHSKYVLRRWLSDHAPGVDSSIRFGHIVVFPSHDQAEGMGPEAPRSIIWDRSDLKAPDVALDRACAHWSLRGMSKALADEITRLLAPQFRMIPSASRQIDDALDQQVQLTEQQWSAFQMLRRHRRALVSGAAGTGKTVLAHARAMQLANSGFRVLLTCFNRPLADRMRAISHDVKGLTVLSFHSMCERFVSESQLGQTVTVTDSQEYWDEVLPELLPDAAELLGRSFDAIVVDEGQDFHPHWWTSLELLLDDDGVFVVFADGNQAIYVSDWQVPFPAEPFMLDVNCRNTQEIAERVYRTGLGTEATLGTRGPAPVSRTANNRRKSIERTMELVSNLCSEHALSPERIVVLTTSGDLWELLDGADWPFPLCENHGDDGLFIETVHRFKGLESDAVVVVFDPDEVQDTDELRRLAYVGMSRARVVMGVVASSAVLDAIEWAID